VLTDVIIVVVDHWEPGGNAAIVQTWMSQYRSLARRHLDSDGKVFQHTFFFPIETVLPPHMGERGYQVDSLVSLCRDGYGDVEVHWHHGGDSSSSFRTKLRAGLDSLQAHGALGGVGCITHFAFIHGNWALDNSRCGESGDEFCGVNDEISLLKSAGCYADFTFPSLKSVAQPKRVNSIFYCVDDPERPKSYDLSVESRVGYRPEDNEFLLIEGPLLIDWRDWRFHWHPTIDDGCLYPEMLASAARFDLWLRGAVVVPGRENWRIVRLFTHGCGPGGVEANMGPEMDTMLSGIEREYRDGGRYRLHYMTARELFNVIKAAEAGRDGDANDYRNFQIGPYGY
jgi:hypothetical protein